MTIPRVCHGWMHGAFGHPSKVLKYTSSPLPDLSSSKLLVRLKGSPVNAADVNMVQGTYPVRPDLSSLPGGLAVAGNEGLWEIVSAGSEASSKFAKGDWVLPARQGLGLWRDFAVVESTDVIRIPSNIGLSVLNAATVAVNPCTGMI
jgi:trans-2-enoyl-CoA reductase